MEREPQQPGHAHALAHSHIVLTGSQIAQLSWWPALHAMINAAFQHKPVQAFPAPWTRLDRDLDQARRDLGRDLGEHGRLVVLLDDQEHEHEHELRPRAAHLWSQSGAAPEVDVDVDVAPASDDRRKSRPIACAAVVPYHEPIADSVISSTSAAFIEKERQQTQNPSEERHNQPHQYEHQGRQGHEEQSTVTNKTNRHSGWEILYFCVSPSHRGQGLSKEILTHLEAFARSQDVLRLYSNYCVLESGDYWPRMGFETVSGGRTLMKAGSRPERETEGTLEQDLHFRMGVKMLS